MFLLAGKKKKQFSLEVLLTSILKVIIKKLKKIFIIKVIGEHKNYGKHVMYSNKNNFFKFFKNIA